MPRGIPKKPATPPAPPSNIVPLLRESVELLERSVTNIGGTTSVLGGAPVFDAPDEEWDLGSLAAVIGQATARINTAVARLDAARESLNTLAP